MPLGGRFKTKYLVRIIRQESFEAWKKAQEAGMAIMFDDGLDKVVKGITTIEEVLRVTKIESL